MSKQPTEELFRAIKPACLHLLSLVLVKDATEFQDNLISISKSLNNLHTTLLGTLDQIRNKYYKCNSKTEVPIDPNVAEYIYFLLSNLLNKQQLSNQILEYVYKLLNILIDQCWIVEFNNDLLIIFPLLTFSLTNGGKGADSNEIDIVQSTELQKTCISCALSLLKSININGKQDVFFQKNQNSIVHFISALIVVITSSQDNELPVESIQCLEFLVFNIIKDKNMVTLIFPGIISKLMKFLIENTGAKIHYETIILTINFLQKLLVYLLSDEDFEIQNDPKTTAKLLLKKPHKLADGNKTQSIKPKDSHSVRTSKWLEATTQNLGKFIPKLTNQYRNSTNKKIKASLLKFVTEILANCHQVLPDELDEQLTENACYLLGNNEELIEPEGINSKNETLLQRRLLDLIKKSAVAVSSIFYSSDQQEITAKINTIMFNTNYLLKLQLKLQVDSELKLSLGALIEKIMDELIILQNTHESLGSKQKIFNLKITDDKSTSFPTLAKSDNATSKEKANFQANLSALARKSSILSSDKAFDDKALSIFSKILSAEVESTLKAFFQTLGKYSIAGDIIERLMLNQGHSTLHKSICLWACNNIVTGASIQYSGIKQVSDVSFNIDQFLDLDGAENGFDEEHYIETVPENEQNSVEGQQIKIAEGVLSMLELAQTMLASGTDFPSGNSIMGVTSKRSAHLENTAVSISLDTIAAASLFLKNDFEPELIDYLYPVIESLSSPSGMIVTHAQNATIQVARNVYNDTSIENLIIKNSDYLLDSLNLKLVNIAVTPDTIKVLIVLIKIAGVELIEKLGDVINSSFVLLDMYHGYTALCNGFFAAFSEILNSVYQTYVASHNFEENVFDKHEEEIRSRAKPWGISSKEQMFDLLDNSKKDLPDLFKHKPDNGDCKLANEALFRDEDEVDSDDEDQGFEGSTQVEDDAEKTGDDMFKYQSHIPRNLYQLVQRICSYCVRFLQYPSFSLKIQIYSMLHKIIQILAVELRELYPILYDLWLYTLTAAAESLDIRINIHALRTIHSMLKYGGTFLNKNFQELWSALQRNSNFINHKKKLIFFKNKLKLENEGAAARDISDWLLVTFGKKHFPESLEYEYYQALNEVLILGLHNCGDTLPLAMIRDIIQNGCGMAADVEEFGIHADVAWYLYYG